MAAPSLSLASLASTQEDDDVASMEYGTTTAASYHTEDEEVLLNLRSSLTPPLAYGDNDDDVSEKAAAHPHPHHTTTITAEDDEATMEVARRDATAAPLSLGDEFRERVHELLNETKQQPAKESLVESEIEDEEDEDYEETDIDLRLDSEEEGVQTAVEIRGADRALPPLLATPRRPETSGSARGGGASASVAARGSGQPFPPTPRPYRMRMPQMGASGGGVGAPLNGHPPPHPHHFFPPPPHSMYGGPFNPGMFGPLGFGGPSMRPFGSLIPHNPFGTAVSGLGRPLHAAAPGAFHHPRPLPPRAYMGGGPPASLAAPAARSRPYHVTTPFPVHGASLHHQNAPPPPPRAPFSPMLAAAAAAGRFNAAAAAMSTPRRDAMSSPATLSASPRTAPIERPFGRLPRLSPSPPTMASLGIGRSAAAATMGGLGAVAAASAATELTPYPLVYVSPAGAISCVLNHDIVVEMAVDRSVRVVFHDHFSAFCNSRGTSSAILHPEARILHTEEYVHSKFINNNEKMAIFGEQGVLFTMSHLSEAYLVNSAAFPGASAVSLDQLQFPSMDDDYTIKMFYTEAQTGPQFIAHCKDIVSEATYDRRPDGSLYLHINGMLIRQSTAGDVIIDARPRQISCSPLKKSVHVRSGCIDMAVEEDERGYVKRELKRVHVSRSGMVISDGNCITSMDHFGRIVCCN